MPDLYLSCQIFQNVLNRGWGLLEVLFLFKLAAVFYLRDLNFKHLFVAGGPGSAGLFRLRRLLGCHVPVWKVENLVKLSVEIRTEGFFDFLLRNSS